MTDGTQELSEIIREMRYRVLEDNGLTVNGLTTIEQETKQSILDWRNKQTLELLDRLDKQINWNKHDMGELGKFIRTVYAHNAIQAERAKLKEVK